ncbi:MAG: hypothetical protein H7146_02155 [Burkholderiaceae bacterium]|nr:hypothetical protein [Microbacteriaceae bacterium]
MTLTESTTTDAAADIPRPPYDVELAAVLGAIGELLPPSLFRDEDVA